MFHAGSFVRHQTDIGRPHRGEVQPGNGELNVGNTVSPGTACRLQGFYQSGTFQHFAAHIAFGQQPDFDVARPAAAAFFASCFELAS